MIDKLVIIKTGKRVSIINRRPHPRTINILSSSAPSINQPTPCSALDSHGENHKLKPFDLFKSCFQDCICF